MRLCPSLTNLHLVVLLWFHAHESVDGHYAQSRNRLKANPAVNRANPSRLSWVQPYVDLGNELQASAKTVESTWSSFDGLTWKDNPNLPKGAQSSLLFGDPTKAGELVIQRTKYPPNYQLPPHTHPYTETATVISGSIGYGIGEKFEKKGDMIPAGTFFAQPAKHPHYLWTGNEGAITQVQFITPGGITYINPADDPRKK